MNKATRTLIVRIAAVAVVVALGVTMFFVGKMHTILLDNNRTDDGLRALDEVYVSVDGGDEIDIYARMRDQAEVMGQSHTITVRYTDDNWNEVTLERDIDIPVGETYVMVSLPTLVANPDAPQDVWCAPFESQAITVDDTASDEVVLDETAGLMDF